MSKKDYTLIAEIIAQVSAGIWNLGSVGPGIAFACDKLRAENPRFDESKFRAAIKEFYVQIPDEHHEA